MSRLLRVAALLLILLFTFTLGVSAQTFGDIQNHWARAQIERLAALGIIGGYSDGTFRPDNPITRAEAVTIIDRFRGRVQTKLDELEGYMAGGTPSAVLADGLGLKIERVSHSADEERLAINVQGFVRNKGREAMPFNPNQLVLIMQNAEGETLGVIRPQEAGEPIRLGAGEGRQVAAAFQISGEELSRSDLDRLVVGVVDNHGQIQAIGIVIRLECTWPPLRCRLTISVDF